MSEYIGKIRVSKDTMLFVVNSVLGNKIKSSTTKDNIFKMIPKIYEEADSKELIKLLPYDTYQALEELIEYVKKSDDVGKFYYDSKHPDKIFLEEAMIIIRHVKYLEENYSLNPGVIEKITKILSPENRKLAEIYGKIERLTIGMLYSYGIVEFDFLRKTICKYMNEIISAEELHDLYFKRLNLNTMVNYENIHWNNTKEVECFVSYLDENEDEIDLGNLAAEQKSRGLKYKQFSEKEILSRKEYLWNKLTREFFKYMKKQNRDLWDFQFEQIVKRNELGENIMSELLSMCMFDNESEIDEFMNQYMKWYNNSPQYLLCGYSPVEFGELNR